VDDVRAQSGVEVQAVVSVPDQGSLPAADRLAGWQLVVGTRGLAAQRNAALDVLDDADLVFFFDDDAVVRPDYLARAVAFFAEHPEVVGLTGRVLLDGATSGEIPADVAAAAIEASTDEPITGAWQSTRELYGCNFAYRRSAAPDLRFDGRLPLYSWLEDHDFARRLMRVGTLARVEDCVIVHRAASSGGRQAHARLGYSQMMNPVYLWRKGSFPLWLATHEIVWRTGKNLVYSVAGVQSSWRRERLRGNALAVLDIVRGRFTPERILEL
jgi:GT2 family glycosyltransferase